jgi:predicted dienelactone hydrolase
MFDWLLISALAICVLAAAMRRVVAPHWSRWLRLAASTSCLLQLVAQGPRLELVPAYVVAAVFGVLVLVDVARNGRRTEAASSGSGSRIATFTRWTAIGGATVSLLLAVMLSVVLHSLDYPLPTGPYAIGTSELRLTDTSREELFTEFRDDAREILVRVSYPAMESAALDRLPQDTIPSIAALVVGALWPNSITPSWGAMLTHAKRNAPLASALQRYPVLIFSHGMGAYPEQNTALVEHLASHGYIVMAINHPFVSSGFRFADGSMIGLDIVRRPDPFPNSEEQDLQEGALQAMISDEQHASTREQESLLRQLAAVNPRSNKRWADMHELMSDDQRFLLGSLNSLQTDSLFTGRLDLDRVGVFGMSSGGTASHMTCALDRRCRAGLNMDGFWPLLLDLPALRLPFMHMSREGNFRHTVAHERSEGTSYVVRIRGSEHLSFTDDVLTLHRLQGFGAIGTAIIGTIDGERMVQLVNEHVLAFFDASLLEQREPLLQGPTDRYPEVTLLSKP